jgi:CubicO group peptidase (beta-lactamase class C family)
MTSTLAALPLSFARRVCLGFALGAVAIGGAHADQIDDYVTAQMDRQHIPGLALAVVKDGKPVKVRGYGVANLELGTPVSPESVFALGSISKQFIATGIVLLNKEGKLGFDDSIRKYLPDAPETWQHITVRHALTHTGGLVREAPAFDALKPQSDADVIKSAYAAPLAFAPGEKFAYSNLGYFVLAEIISRVAHEPWPQYLQEKVFAPLGMNATRTTSSADLVSQRASGYEWKDGKHSNGATLIGVRPSGAFLSTIQDMVKWDAALSSNNPIPQQLLEQMWTPVKLNDGSENPYGFGWELDKVGGHRQVHHGGTMLTGYRAQMARFVDDRVTVIALTNSLQALPERVTLGVAAFYIDGLLPKRKTMQLSTADLDAYTGKYELGADRVLTVSRREHQLLLTMTFEEHSMELGLLSAEDKSRFFQEDDPRRTYVFSKNERGQVQLVMQNTQGTPVQRVVRTDPKK